MKAALAALVLLVAAGCGGTKTVTRTVTVERAGKRDVVYYGHIKSLTGGGKRFVLKFDPAWLLSGTAAERAAVEDKVLQPGEPVPNDNYTVEEGDRLLTFDVSPGARVTMVGKGIRLVTVSVDELAQILAGKNPKQRALFDPSTHSGFWITIGDKYPNPVVALEQQYHP